MTIEILVGKIITEIKNEDNEITFVCSDGKKYKMFHEQDCCEDVHIESIDSDINDLIGNIILEASERSENDDDAPESGTWTFYVIRNVKASVTIRWYGSSNGYYSERVSVDEI